MKKLFDNGLRGKLSAANGGVPSHFHKVKFINNEVESIWQIIEEELDEEESLEGFQGQYI